MHAPAFPRLFRGKPAGEERRAGPHRRPCWPGIDSRLSEVEIEKSLRFARDPDPAARAARLAAEALGPACPKCARLIQTDVEAAYQGDPAARSVEEIILAYPCVLAISLQRFAHVLYGSRCRSCPG
jgi:hypothetical protein